MLPRDLVVERQIAFCDEGGRVVLLAPRFDGKGLSRLFKRLFGQSFVRVKLDELGTHVWNACDGDTPIDTMVSSLEMCFGTRAGQAEARLELFLSTLQRNGWVRLLQPTERG